MEVGSINFSPLVSPTGNEKRTTDEHLEDLEKVIRSLQYEILSIRRDYESLEQRTKILIKHYNVKMAVDERG